MSKLHLSLTRVIALSLLVGCGSGTNPDGGVASDGSTRDAGPPGDAGPPPPPLPPSGCNPDVPTADVYYVATDGNDDTGDGSMASPWATITQGLDNVPDGSTILVRPGTYTGRVRVRGTFAMGVTVRSEEPYQARLRANGPVITAYTNSRGCEGIAIEGFDMAHEAVGEPLLVHLDGDGTGAVSRITLRNNILHDSYDNDLLKVNNGIRDVLIERNMFYNQAGSDEHIDVNSAQDITIQDNVFLSDYAASGRASEIGTTSSFIVVKDSGGAGDIYTGSSRIFIRRNVFLSYEGGAGTGYILFGEDGQPFFEAFDCVVENNLFLGNNAQPMRAALGVKGSRDILFRNNTLVGDMASAAFAMRINTEPGNMTSTNIGFVNNIFSDPTGTMEDFSDVRPDHIASFTFDHNLFFNGGSPVPEDPAEAINLSDDVAAIIGDPMLGDPAGLITPSFTGTGFADGSRTICEVFESLVSSYGEPGAGSAALGAADPAQAPADDIRGISRGATPSVGAVEGG